MNTRTQYHPLIILKHKLGILEEHHYQYIPTSTLRNWSNRGLEHIYGFDQQMSDELQELVKQFILQKKLHATFRALLAINQCLLMTLNNYREAYNNQVLRQQIVQTILRYSSTLPKSKLFRWCGVAPQQFYAWQRKQCTASFLSLCRLRHVSKLTAKEMKTISSYLNDHLPKLQTKIAVYSKMVREGAAYMSIRTFYDYSRKLGFINKPKLKRHKKIGIIADRPKQILHMDVTVYKFADNTKAYIYLIQDNYSRFILNWKISRSCNSATALANLREACKKYNLLDKHSMDIIVDGGSENKGLLSQFVNGHTPFQLKIAYKDIAQSNSMIEYANRQLKHYYLFPRNISGYEALLDEMPNIMHEMGYERYRHDLGFRTPFEAFDNVDIRYDQITQSFINAKKKRLVQNKAHPCRETCS